MPPLGYWERQPTPERTTQSRAAKKRPRSGRETLGYNGCRKRVRFILDAVVSRGIPCGRPNLQGNHEGCPYELRPA